MASPDRSSFTRHHLLLTAIVLWFLVFVIDAGRADPAPVGPGLSNLAARLERVRPGGDTAPRAGREPSLRVLVRVNHGYGPDICDLARQLGGSVRRYREPVLGITLPAEQVPVLAEAPGIVYISKPPRLKPLLNVSVPNILADQVHDPTPEQLPKAYDGSGIVIGVVDSGIDFTHDDYLHQAGHSRVLYIWDQTENRDPPGGEYNYGAEYSQSQINAHLLSQGIVFQHDIDGHGTHVAGTAASNGGSNGSYVGVAPKADLIIVKTTFDTTDVLNGVDYIFDKAAALNKPCVVNLSLGSHEGAHDGTDDFSDAIAGQSGTGRIIVAAAGNEGDASIHLGYAAAAGGTGARSTPFYLWSGSIYGYVDIWYEQPGQIDFRVEAYDLADNKIGDTDWVAPGWTSTGNSIESGGTVYGVMDLDAAELQNPHNQARHVRFDVEGGQIDSANIYFKIWSRGSGFFDAWVEDGWFGTSDDGAAYSGNNEKTVGLPACAGNIIAVANYVTKRQWVDYNGTWQSVNEDLSDIAASSSRGPSRNEVLTGHKPDIAAPGTYIAAALSEDAEYWTDPSDMTQDGKHVHYSGTSMSSPHIAGVVALMLQKKSTLTTSEIISIFETSSVQHDIHYDGTPPTYTWGHGKVNTLAAMQAISVSAAGVPTGTITLTATPTSLVASGTDTATVVSNTIFDSIEAAIADGEKFNVAITSGGGGVRAVSASDFRTSTVVESLEGSIAFIYQPGATPGTTVITADSQNGTAVGSVSITVYTSAPGTGEDAGGGCFIATAAYGGTGGHQMALLRFFRDECLLRLPGGRDLVDLYYTLGPKAAEVVNSNSTLKPAIRLMLEPLVEGIRTYTLIIHPDN